MPTAMGQALPTPAAAGEVDVAARLDNLEVELTTLWVLVSAFFVFQVR